MLHSAVNGQPLCNTYRYAFFTPGSNFDTSTAGGACNKYPIWVTDASKNYNASDEFDQRGNLTSRSLSFFGPEQITAVGQFVTNISFAANHPYLPRKDTPVSQEKFFFLYIWS